MTSRGKQGLLLHQRRLPRFNGYLKVLMAQAAAFEEFVILDFRASNRTPYPFDWVNKQRAADEYAAALQRISRLYEKRF